MTKEELNILLEGIHYEDKRYTLMSRLTQDCLFDYLTFGNQYEEELRSWVRYWSLIKGLDLALND